jgi:hypothetical protein
MVTRITMIMNTMVTQERGVNKGKRKGRGEFPARQIDRGLRGLRQAAVEVLVAPPAESNKVL